ncbi:branched-chain amino acid ABC transporter permease [Burkholderia sp. Bp9140]|uniref:branched-chain amino acid ABC transporter permease n=1 Tax=Burkholderia sp. Bp9140 TaxID=2184572 RepID=UPI000F57F060|nr:branched-chain amino acid ABC transporter permease [Burkholderia sp. Bp9140]RQR45389.1 branched-chain amino acid ABC transporter permease [Burkholderia sp. Bp9140]
MRQLIIRHTFFLVLIATGICAPYLLDPFHLVAWSGYAALAIGGLGLAFVWGTLGVLSLGHTAFFGLGAYAYALCALNTGSSTWAIVVAVALPVVVSLALGYFLFFSRLGDVYLSVITLCVTLIFFSFFSSTADPFYHLGSVPLGGFNGINGAPGLNIPGQPAAQLSVEATFVTCVMSLAIVYAALTWLRKHRTGRVMAAIRENELRSELLGYDVRLYKLLGYALSAMAAGLSGALYTSVSGFVGPNAFDLSQASQFVLWVIAGGLGTLAGPVVASLGFQLLASYLGTSQTINTELVFGTVIIVFVLLVPQGILPWITTWSVRLRRIAPISRAPE